MCKQSEEEARRQVEKLQCREREEREAERERMHERARRARESGEAGLRKGSIPVALSRVSVVPPTILNSLRHVRFISDRLLGL